MTNPMRAALIAGWLVLAGPVAAQQGPVVVELFTSQGCSSCPPADALMHDLAARDDVLPLALHVDYWDYIGWKDSFADPAHGRRQKGYAHAAGRDMVYTPQMVIGGQEALAGTHPMKLAELIDRHRGAPARARIRASRAGSEVAVTVAPLGAGLDGEYVVQLVRFDPLRHVEIERGENAGRSLDYANVVTGWDEIGRWDGQGERAFTARPGGDGPLAVLVQQQGYGAIVAAARID